MLHQIKYHEEFEKGIKGTKLSVVDEPESQRQKQMMSLISQVEYKGLHAKHADMEAKRNLIDQGEEGAVVDRGNGGEGGGLVDRVEYKGLHAKHADMEAKRNLIDQGEEGAGVDRGNGGGGGASWTGVRWGPSWTGARGGPS